MSTEYSLNTSSTAQKGMSAPDGNDGHMPHPTFATKVTNIVLVHGALVDASGWRPIYNILTQKGFNVSLVSQPLTSRAADIAAVRRVLDLQSGPTILVGHSYGGVLITEAGNDPRVKALVYVSALQPDAGESPFELLQSIPAASQGVRFTADGFAYLDPAHYHGDFAADLPKVDTDFMAKSQMFVAVESLQAPVSVAAWHEKPSYAIVATQDRSLAPDLQRKMYQRAKSKITELTGSHAIYMSQPDAVAAVILTAAREEG
jgi:pimeloyl-ACP methyl ester carboxylesterase